MCISHIASSGLCIVGIKRYLLMPLIIHRAKNCSTCAMRVAMGHEKMNKIRSQFQSLPQGHHLVQASNSQKALNVDIFTFEHKIIYAFLEVKLTRLRTEIVHHTDLNEATTFCNSFYGFYFKELISLLSYLCKLVYVSKYCLSISYLK